MRAELWTSTLAAVVFAACSSNASSKTVNGPALTHTAAYCERLDRCKPHFVRDNFGDVSTCTLRLGLETADEFESTGTTITAEMVAACVPKMGEAPCDVLTSAIPECRFAGALDAGAPCGSGVQCKSGSCFRTSSITGALALCGVCSTRVPAFGDCTKANCEGGLACAGGRCKELAAAGASCDTQSAPCKPNLQCFGGKCEVQLAAGAACTPARVGEADALLCDSTQLLFCVPSAADPRSGKCSTVHYGELGEACGLDPVTKELSVCAGALCSSSDHGTCVADLKEGESCGDSDASCAVPLSCIAGKCGLSSIGTCR